MNIKLTSEQQKIIQAELESGHFRTTEEVIAEALRVLRDRANTVTPKGGNGVHREAVQAMLTFVKENRTRLEGVSVKQLIHEGRRL